MSTLTYLDGYCERAGDPGIWGEPANLLTNGLFILAAILAARILLKAKKHGLRERGDQWLLIAALLAIGIGSGLWHAIPNGHTVLLDVIPITIYIHVYLIAALRRLLRFDWTKTLSLWGNFLLAGILAQLLLPPDMLNGTIMYIPTYATLIILTVALWRRDAARGRVFLNVVIVWTASLIFRTVDMDICPHFALGTHFLWHSLNAWVLYRLFTVLAAA